MLILIATIRACTANALAYVFVAGIASLFVALLALAWYVLVRPRARVGSRGPESVIGSLATQTRRHRDTHRLRRC